jgi:predicted naringenin-chalcone synthase
MNNILSSLLFSDGSAAVLVTQDDYPLRGLHIDGFYSEIVSKGKKDMSWELSSTGFQMGLSSYMPDLIEEDFAGLVTNALGKTIHPGRSSVIGASTREAKRSWIPYIKACISPTDTWTPPTRC